MKIVVLDGYTENPWDLSWDDIGRLGELTVYERTPEIEDVIIERIKDAEVLVANKARITKRIIDGCPSLKYITILATGYDVVDYKYAAEKGIPVSNVPAYGTASVSQFSVALLLEICHHIGHHAQTVVQGRWQECEDFCYWDYPLIELAGKTAGIIGFGRIGKAEARVLNALGMRVLAADPHPSEEGRALAEYVDMERLLGESDVISLHCNLTPENTGFINKDTISKMKDGVIIINNARGQLIAEQDLADALNRGKVMAAGLDVVSTEPIRNDNPLLTAKNCIITPHISWAPKESRQRIMDCTLQNIKSYMDGAPQNVVN